MICSHALSRWAPPQPTCASECGSRRQPKMEEGAGIRTSVQPWKGITVLFDPHSAWLICVRVCAVRCSYSCSTQRSVPLPYVQTSFDPIAQCRPYGDLACFAMQIAAPAWLTLCEHIQVFCLSEVELQGRNGKLKLPITMKIVFWTRCCSIFSWRRT